MVRQEQGLPPHALGVGRLVVPQAEVDSRRWGTVLLVDEQGHPVTFQGAAFSGRRFLTVSRLAGAEPIEPGAARTHLLGAGRYFRERSQWQGRPGIAVGVFPDEGRLTGWLHVPCRADMAEQPIMLEAHPVWPCPCEPGRQGQWFASGEAA